MQQRSDGVLANRSVAVMLEAFAGWLGFLGVGHFLIGDRTTGLIMLIGWWLGLAVLIAISVASLGAGLLCTLPIWFIVPVISAITLLVLTAADRNKPGK